MCKTRCARFPPPQHRTSSSGASTNLSPGESIPDPATAGSHSPSPLHPVMDQTGTRGFEWSDLVQTHQLHIIALISTHQLAMQGKTTKSMCKLSNTFDFSLGFNGRNTIWVICLEENNILVMWRLQMWQPNRLSAWYHLFPSIYPICLLIN